MEVPNNIQYLKACTVADAIRNGPSQIVPPYITEDSRNIRKKIKI